MSLTPTQQRAVDAGGNILLMAGAGTGKTHTLVERCLRCLLDPKEPAALDEILIVTFTDAAAAEVKQRIRKRLESELRRPTEAGPDGGGRGRLQEQLALFESAPIGTLHGFCFQLIREHFYELGLDPQVAILPEEESRLMAEEALETVLNRHYQGGTPEAAAVQALIQSQGGGWDKPVRQLLMRIHHYTQTLPDPARWLVEQTQFYAAQEPGRWQEWLQESLSDWPGRWRAFLEAQGQEVAMRCLQVLETLKTSPSLEQARAACLEIQAATEACPKTRLKPLKSFLDEARFLGSLLEPQTPAPLQQDWDWVRPQMAALLGLARQFEAVYSETKHELGVLDFHDLEQFALRLLWDPQTRAPTGVAEQWRKKLRYVFVDEYQDINAAQDKIIEMLSRPEGLGNRFLVGDVKQSIYRFRLADPHIFQSYAATWRALVGQVIPLVENFRSGEGVLNVVNSIFGLIMRSDLGGLTYDEGARLRFGAPESRATLAARADSEPRVHLHLRIKGKSGNAETDTPDEGLAEITELEEAGKEARLVALQLRQLRQQEHRVWDESLRSFRPVEWRDMAVLLRSPSKKANAYAREFARVNVPLEVGRGRFYESLEVTDLLSLLQLFDNPLQDLPLLAVLRSPLVGLSLDELATIRLAAAKTRFWSALVLWEEGARRGAPSELRSRVSQFLERHGRWRQLARQVSLSQCLDNVLAETRYDHWLLAQPQGGQRHANLMRLLELARRFDQFQRHGLFRFLRYIEAQQEAGTEPEVPAVTQENSVRLLSIHQSKGLEFPVVVVADVAKPFNEADLKADIILDEKCGLCPQIKPPHSGKRYPSLPYWMARRRQHGEMLGEELRLLYVAMTRSRDTLLLTGTVSATQFEQLWSQADGEMGARLSRARSYADWLGAWFAHHRGGAEAGQTAGVISGVAWRIYEDADLVLEQAEPKADTAGESVLLRLRPAEIMQRLDWTYPHAGAVGRPAKASVSALRKQAEQEEPSYPIFPANARGRAAASSSAARTSQPFGGGADVGTAHHLFLQFVSLEATGSVEQLRAEAARMEREGKLSAEQRRMLNYPSLLGFWQSGLGRSISEQPSCVHRELAFTARFDPDELAELTGTAAEPALEPEFVLVQGVVDLAVIRPEEIWIIDFKTDSVLELEISQRARVYEPQIELYRRALRRIYQRPVTRAWLYFLLPGQAAVIQPRACGRSAEVPA